MIHRHTDRTVRHRGAHVSLVAVCAVIAAAGCTGATTPTHEASLLAVKSTTKTVSLVCKDGVALSRAPAGYSVLFNRAGLPGYEFGAYKTGFKEPARKYFAKQGLSIKVNTSFDLIVPAAWASRVKIGWGNPGGETTHLHVGPCRSLKAGKTWLGFAGGWVLNKPACVPLIVRTATAQKTVHIGAGKACPGQKPR